MPGFTLLAMLISSLPHCQVTTNAKFNCDFAEVSIEQEPRYERIVVSSLTGESNRERVLDAAQSFRSKLGCKKVRDNWKGSIKYECGPYEINENAVFERNVFWVTIQPKD